MEAIEDEYYTSVTPSITSALEEAVQAANRLLHEYNAGAPLHKQAYLGVTCAVVHGRELYIAQVQPARALVVHRGSPRTFPEGQPRAEAELTPLGLDARVDVELYRSPFLPGDTVTLLSSGLARVVGRAEDEYGLSYQDHAGATSYLAHLAARENLLDEHALVVEAPARKSSPSTMEALGREWVRRASERASGPLQGLAARLRPQGGGDGGGKDRRGAAASWIRERRDDASRLHFSLPTWPSQPMAQPSRLQVAATLLGALLLLVLAVGLGTRAYHGYKQTSRFEDLLAAAQGERQQARGKTAEEALRHLKAAQGDVTEAQRLFPKDARAYAELARIQADRNAVNKVVRLPQATPLTRMPGSQKAGATKLIVVGKNALLLDKVAGTVRMYDLQRRRLSTLSPSSAVRFVGLSWREGGVVALDRTGKVWDYDLQSKTWSSLKLGGTAKWRDVLAFDTYGTRAYVSIKGRKGVLAYDLSASAKPKILAPKTNGQPLVPTSLSADGNLWALQGRDDSIWKLSNDRVTRRIWVDAEPAIEGTFGLVALDTNQDLYMLDKTQERVLRVSPTGQLRAQLYLPGKYEGAGRIAAAYPDEAAGQVYLLVDGSLQKAPLPKLAAAR
jgi:hypothetical protein